MLFILCCSSNDYTLEKSESISPEHKSGLKAEWSCCRQCLTFCCCFADNRENRAVIAFVLFNILEYVNISEIVRCSDHEQYTLPAF